MGVADQMLGVAAGATLAFSLTFSRRNHDSNCLALLQVFIWTICALMDAFMSPPESKLANPLIDLGLGFWVTFLWARRRDGYKLVFLALLGLQGAMHVIYQQEFPSHSVAWTYTLGLNITYLAQLVCVAWPGLSNVAGHVSRFLRSHHSGFGREGVQ